MICFRSPVHLPLHSPRGGGRVPAPVHWLFWGILGGSIGLPGWGTTGLSQVSDPPATTRELSNSPGQPSDASDREQAADPVRQEAEAILDRLEERIRNQEADLELLKLFASSLAEIEKNYVEKVDRRRLIEAAIDGMLQELDRYSDYIPPEETTQFETEIESEYGGIGIRVTQYPDEDYLTLATTVLDSPSYQAGVEAGTWIIQIGGQNAKGLTVDQAVEATQGEIGALVDLKLRDKSTGQESSFRIPRAVIKVPTVLGDRRLPSHRWNYFLETDGPDSAKLGYVRVVNFGRETGEELKRVMQELLAGKMQGLILDLRFNRGGLLASAIDVADLFVDEGLIVRTEGRNAIPRRWLAKKPGTLPSFPMAVLVNDQSASASEIVAACLQDTQRAVIIGERTFGKGSVQNIIQLEDGKSLLKLTTAAYFRPNGKNIDRRPEHVADDTWGVQPNAGFEVEMDEQAQREYFEQRQNRDVIWSDPKKAPVETRLEDPQRDRAIDWLRQTLRGSAANDGSPAGSR